MLFAEVTEESADVVGRSRIEAAREFDQIPRNIRVLLALRSSPSLIDDGPRLVEITRRLHEVMVGVKMVDLIDLKRRALDCLSGDVGSHLGGRGEPRPPPEPHQDIIIDLRKIDT